MTTSVLLNACRNGLNDNDLQVIRDYALEAPWNWRMALDELVEAVEGFNEALNERDAAKDQYEEMRETLNDFKVKVEKARRQMLRYVEKLELGRRSGNLTKGDIDMITTGVRNAFDELEEKEKVESKVHQASPVSPG